MQYNKSIFSLQYIIETKCSNAVRHSMYSWKILADFEFDNRHMSGM